MRKITIFFLFFITIIISSCQPKKLIHSATDYYQYFDTVIILQVWDTEEYDSNAELWKGAEIVIKSIQETFQREPSNLVKEPELYKLNKTAGTDKAVKVSDDLFEVIKMSMEFAKKTNGKLDPTVGPLVDLWDINARAGEKHNPPSQAEIDALLPLIDYNSVELNEKDKTVKLIKPGMILDLGAIAKGYAADKLAEYFKDKGIKHAIINLGGNIYVLGKRYEKRLDGTDDWVIGVRDPSQCAECSIANVYLSDKTVVTSGIYERYFTDPDDNTIYHHILDPDTGYPYQNNISSVTIITDSSAVADALSTSVFALGSIQNGIDFLEEYFPEVEAIFIDKNLKIYTTSNIDDYKFTILNQEQTGTTTTTKEKTTE